MSAPSPIILSMSLAIALSLVLPSHGFLSPPSFVSFGYCMNAFVQPGLDLKQFSGLWYTVEKVPNEYDPDVACTNTDYAFYGDHLRSSQRGLLADRSKHKINTLLTLDNETIGVMMVHSPGIPLAPLMVLSTDYGTYACMYTCIDLFGFKAEFAYTLSKTPLATKATLETCRDVYATKAGMNPESFVLIEQGKTCPYWFNQSSNVTAHILRGEKQVQADEPGSAIRSRIQRTTNSATSSSSSSPVLRCIFSILLLLVVAARPS